MCQLNYQSSLFLNILDSNNKRRKSIESLDAVGKANWNL